MNEKEQWIAKMIDHAVLHPSAGIRELEDNCRLASQYRVASVCVKPYAVTLARGQLAGSGVMTGTVIGFPHGNSAVQVKVFETQTALNDGADEIDMVVNIAKVIENDWNYLEEEIGSVLKVVRNLGKILKVIYETDLLGDDSLKIKLCELCSSLKVDYVKTSTGFGYVRGVDGHLMSRGATVHDVQLMRKHSSPEVLVKASGGVRTLDDLLVMNAAGAARIGTSATKEIMDEAKRRYRDGECLQP